MTLGVRDATLYVSAHSRRLRTVLLKFKVPLLGSVNPPPLGGKRSVEREGHLSG